MNRDYVYLAHMQECLQKIIDYTDDDRNMFMTTDVDEI